MAILSNQQRREVAADIMRALSARRIDLSGVSKQDIIDWMVFTDGFQNDKAAEYNAGLPASIKALPGALKAEGFSLMANKRWGAS